MKKMFLVLLVCFMASMTTASPYFHVDGLEDWEALLPPAAPPMQHARGMLPIEWNNYMVQWDDFLEDGLPYNDGQPTDFFEPELYVYPGDPSVPEYPDDAGLVMAWGDGDPQPGRQYASAWILDYGIDPDLTNCTITVTATPPSGSAINAISFGIQDVNGNIRSWWWQVPGMIPYDVPTTITINTAIMGIGATNPPATGFMNNPGFNLKMAQDFIADENAQWVGGPVPVPPPGSGMQTAIWNYWHDIIVRQNIKTYKGNYVKFSQPPEVINPEIPMILGWDVRSVLPFNFDNGVMINMAADDWKCYDDRPITDVHWWGSFIGWTQPTLPPQVPDYFLMCIWSDIPQSADGSQPSRPAELLWTHKCYKWVWNFAGWDEDPRFRFIEHPDYNWNLLGDPQMEEACFQFNQLLSEDEWFYQEPMEDPDQGNTYWLSIAAVYENMQLRDIQFPWGWKSKPYDPTKAPDAAVVITQLDSNTPPWDVFPGSTTGHVTKVANFFPLLLPDPMMYPEGEWYDLAFELTTNEREPGKCYDLEGDINHDCIVDLNDFAILAGDWLMTTTP